MDDRKHVAEQMYGCDTSNMTASDYEKYGYLASKDVSQISSNESYNAAMYGKVAVRFKKEAVQDTATYTLGDSIREMDRHGKATSGSIGKDVSITGVNPDMQKVAYDKLSRLKGKQLSNPDPCTIADSIGEKEYFEVQYHGDLSVKDIDSVTITVNMLLRESDLATINTLKENGVKVYQLKGGEAHEL